MPDGSVYRPRYWVSCSAALDILSLGSGGQDQRAPDGVKETLLDYTVLLYSNGDVEVDCGASIGSDQSGSIGRYFPAVTRGAQTGSCNASSDYPPIGKEVGFWEFETTSGPHAQYMDPDNPLGLNGFVHSYVESECNSTVLGDDGKWTQVKLADVF